MAYTLADLRYRCRTMNRLAIVLALAATSGCKKSVKTAEVETWMKARTTELGINASKVTCPKDIEPKEGKSFDCELDVEGKAYTIVGTITKVESSKVNFDTSWKNGANGVIIRSKLVPALVEDLSKTFATKVDIACAEPLLFLDAKRAATCDLTAGTTKAKLVVTFDDKLAPTGWKLDPPLLAKTKLEELLTTAVREKTAPNVNVTCGTEPLIARPADGFLACEAGDGTKKVQLKVEVDADLNVKRWETI